MSADEDTELRDLVAQTLENNGVLGKIRAEIRASVFLALEEQDKVHNKTPFVNQELKTFLSSKEGQTTAALVYEFLDYFNLDFTVAVFNPETNFSDKYEGRENLAKELNIKDSEKSRPRPLICELLRKVSGGGDNPTRAKGESTNTKDLTSKQISDARIKFDNYDMDKNGIIDKDELRSLFVDIFPHFHRNMLERYVNDEFKSVDQDFSSGIDFEEFLGMYKRLFIHCKSVVAHDVSDILTGSQPKSAIGSIKTGHFDDEFKDTTDRNDGITGQRFNGSKSRSLSGASLGSDDDDDSFFDTSPRHSKPTSIPKPKKKNSPPLSPATSPTSKANGLSSLGNAPPIGGSGMGSLTGAPPLPGLGANKGASSQDWKDLDDINKEIGKLSYTSKDDSHEEDYDDDDYEDDFQSSQGSRSQSQSHGGPRSYKSSEANSIIEDLEVPEDVSGDDIDFFNSSQEKFDDLTADRTASQLSQGGNFDYMEDVQFTT
ncbi:centrosomal protein 43-like isoform X2 [Antedon mediterranea]|uniref:centrosomal protein 43-like isoform X2 n=1 Tax=Antedon mediterranea TaxID=105859 RepID=UPI003AF457F5